jgi:hypothetical protein
MESSLDAVLKYLPQFAVYSWEKIDRLGLVTFSDHPAKEDEPGDYPYKSFGLTGNLEEFAYWVKNLRILNGRDYAESIACAYDVSLKLSDNSNIWIITDAIPHSVLTSPEDEIDDRAHPNTLPGGYLSRDDLCEFCKSFPDLSMAAVLACRGFPRYKWTNIPNRGIVDFDSVFNSNMNEQVVDSLFEVSV